MSAEGFSFTKFKKILPLKLCLPLSYLVPRVFPFPVPRSGKRSDPGKEVGRWVF